MKQWIVFILALFFDLSCATQTQVGRETSTLPFDTCQAIEKFFKGELTAYQEKVDEASKLYQDEQWKIETADPTGSEEKMSKLFEALQKVSYDKSVLAKSINLSKIAEGLSEKDCAWKKKLNRAKELLETSILTNDAVSKKEKENQDKQDALTTKNNSFRITLAGEPEPLSEALLSKKMGSTDDRKLRESLYHQFNSSRADKWLEWNFKDLVKSHNEEARLAGFKNYYDYRFFRNQLDLANYEARVKEVKHRLAPKVRKVIAELAKAYGIKKVEAWDLRYLREKSSAGETNQLLKDLPENDVMAIAKQYYTALGINVDSYGFQMDLYPKKGKNTHAFAMGIIAPHVDDQGKVLSDPKIDIRFLANLKKPVQWDDISTVIHELGHAIHFGEIRQPLAIFRGFGPVETEAIAMTLERMANSKDFLEDVLPSFTKASKESLVPILKRQVRAAQIEQAFVLVRQIFFSEFEHEIYKNPDGDYGKIWAKLFKEYWGITIKPNEADWDVDHFVIAPVYVQNYAIGILMVEQIYDSILRDFKTSYRSKAIGDKLKLEYFGPGMEFNYLDLTRNFTGSPLSAEAALKVIP